VESIFYPPFDLLPRVLWGLRDSNQVIVSDEEGTTQYTRDRGKKKVGEGALSIFDHKSGRVYSMPLHQTRGKRIVAAGQVEGVKQQSLEEEPVLYNGKKAERAFHTVLVGKRTASFMRLNTNPAIAAKRAEASSKGRRGGNLLHRGFQVSTSIAERTRGEECGGWIFSPGTAEKRRKPHHLKDEKATKKKRAN